jgi:hypothetical protein
LIILHQRIKKYSTQKANKNQSIKKIIIKENGGLFEEKRFITPLIADVNIFLSKEG